MRTVRGGSGGRAPGPSRGPAPSGAAWDEPVRVLAVGTAHELNNLLTAVLGYAELLVAREAAGSFPAVAGRGIERAALRASELVSRLAVASAGAAGDREPIDVHGLLQDVAGHLHRAFGPDLRVMGRWRATRATVTGDQARLAQMAIAFAVHVRESIGGRGTLTIGTRNLNLPRAGRSFGLQAGAYLGIAFAGSGAGTRARPGPGAVGSSASGLLLEAARGIVRTLGGDATLGRAGGRNASVDVLLPLDPVSARRPAPVRLPVAAAGGRGLILLVDDEPLVLESTRETLRTLGYQVVTARGGAAAVKLFRARRRQIDLVILDLLMPGMDGSETLQSLRGVDPAVRVVASSAVRDERAVSFERAAGSGFLRKPYRAADLAARVRQALRRHKP